jgi:hypothetical protein
MPPDPSSTPLFDVLRTQAMVYEEAHRIRDLLIAHLLPPPRDTPAQAAGSATQDEVLGLLRRLQVLLLKHPIVTQAAFSALVAEGRRFGATPEGAAWKSALATSELLQQGRRLWDTLSLNIPEEDPSTVIPSAYLEAFFQVAASSDLDGLLRQLQGVAPEGGGDVPAR